MRVIVLVGQRVRSGTNFIGTTLKMHPDVVCTPPNHSLGEFNLFREDDIVRILNKVLESSFGLDKEADDVKKLLKSYGQLWIKFLAEKYDLPSNKVIFIKSPFVRNIDIWRLAFPDSPIAILHRDGRDNVISSVRASNDKRSWHNSWTSFKKRSNYYTGRSFINHTKNWAQTARIIKEIREDTNLRIFRYEDLNNSKNGIADLLNFFGLEVNEEILTKCLNAPVVGSSFGVSKEGIVKPNWKPEHNKEKFVFSGKWKKWNVLKRRVFQSIAGRELKALGYK